MLCPPIRRPSLSLARPVPNHPPHIPPPPPLLLPFAQTEVFLLPPWFENFLTRYFGHKALPRKVWPTLRLCLIGYTVFSVPYALALRVGYDYFDIAVDGVYFLGITATILTALADDLYAARANRATYLTLRRNAVAPGVGPLHKAGRPHFAAHVHEYLTVWFVWDIAANLSYSVARICEAYRPTSQSELYYWLAQLPKLARFRQLQLYFREREMDLYVNVRTVAVFKFVLLVRASGAAVTGSERGCFP